MEDLFSSSGHKIVGYAEFTQGDPRDFEIDKKNDIHLIQIDIDNIMFGDVGLSH